jgi:GT2 family glycosyltransferase
MEEVSYMELPKISIVIVNLNGKQNLIKCFVSILKLNYPKDKIEVIVVDNGSTDGSTDLIKNKFGWIKLLKNAKNEGFAKPSNAGARAASGEYVAFLNNDMMVTRNWLIELVNSIKSNDAQCAGSVIMDWYGDLLDFAGGSINFFGMGYQYGFKKKMSEVEPEFDKDKPLFFACGGSMLVEKKLFLDIGGFDEDYFAYFEDVDFGWRLNILGHKVVLSVKSRVYHKHHSTGKRFTAHSMNILYERNSLYTIYKNYGEELLQKAFWPKILMNNAIAFNHSNIRREDYELQLTDEKMNELGPRITHAAASELCSLNDFIMNLGVMNEKRKIIQANRKVSDEEILKFIPEPFLCMGIDTNLFSNMKYEISKIFDIDKAFHQEIKRHVLIVSSDKIGKKMSGPAIRSYEFAKALSSTCEVDLASCGYCDIQPEGFNVFEYTYENTEELISACINCDIVLIQGFIMEFCKDFAKIAKTKYMIVDLYDPYVIENVEIFKDHDMKTRRDSFEFSSKTLNNQLKDGDFFIAANEKQKDYWLGMLSAFYRISPEVYDITKNPGSIVGNVPFGISNAAPVHNKKVLKGVWPGIKDDDSVLIWGGGVWNWFDPLTLIKAVKRISETRDNVKLFFLGVKSPNPAVPEMQMLNDAVTLSKELGIYDKYVFFNFGWVDYIERQNYLLEADIGVSCHFDTLETRLSFRTRILDYLWCSLPIICTKGDYFSELVEKEAIGYSVEFQNEMKLAEAITSLLDDRAYYNSCREKIAIVSEKYKWNVVTQPLIDFCNHPVHIHYDTKNYKNSDLPQHDESREDGHYSRRNVLNRRLSKIENQLQYDTSVIDKNSVIMNDMLDEMNTMYTTFKKMKSLLNPIKFFKRIFKRR